MSDAHTPKVTGGPCSKCGLSYSLETAYIPCNGEPPLVTIEKMRAEMNVVKAALKECAINEGNPDICGVCGEHFKECEDEKFTLEDPPYNDTTPMILACSGARARLILSNKSEP